VVNKKIAILIAGMWAGSYLSGYGLASIGVIGYEDVMLLKRVTAGIIRKVKELDLRVKDIEERISALERKLSADTEEKCRITASWLRIRECPSFECKVVGLIRKGTEKEILEEKDGWKRVEEGWIKGEYCK